MCLVDELYIAVVDPRGMLLAVCLLQGARLKSNQEYLQSRVPSARVHFSLLDRVLTEDIGFRCSLARICGLRPLQCLAMEVAWPRKISANGAS